LKVEVYRTQVARAAPHLLMRTQVVSGLKTSWMRFAEEWFD